MEEQVVLLHDDELNEEKRNDAREVSSTIHEPKIGVRYGSMSSLMRSFTSLVSRILSRLRHSKHNLSNDAISTLWHLLRSLSSLIFTMILSLRPRYMRTGGLQPVKKAHITTYLDALRGWAAVIVLNSHHNPYHRTWILQQPFARILVHGRGMVDVFFVISGYVLSYRMLKLMRTRQAVPLLDTVVSSVFRRWIRLYGSAGVASFIAMLLVEFKWTRPGVRQKNTVSILWEWVVDFGRFSNVFASVEGYWYKGVLSYKYLDVLWTIPVEFRGSMVLFTFCIAACKLSTRNRMLLCWFLMALSWYWAAVYVALFLGGFFLADLSFTRHPELLGPPSNLPLSTTTSTKKSLSRPQPRSEKIFYSLMLICGLFLLSQVPNPSKAVWPWPILDSLIPANYRGTPVQEHWWLSIGALLLVCALDSYPTLQTPFKWNFSRYLGDLSFGIYVMHFPVIWTIWANFINPLILHVFGPENLWGYTPFMILNYALVLWAADLFIRVDQRVVALGRWAQGRFFVW